MVKKNNAKKTGKKVDVNILKSERTLVLVKPDGVKRGLTGDIIGRFEKAGLKIVALKMVWPTREHFIEHYPGDKAYLESLGAKTLKAYKEYGIDSKVELGTSSKLEIGKMVKDWLVNFMTSGPVVAMIIQGLHAVDSVRMIVGPTLPIFASPGSIRGDYSFDSPSLANTSKRAVKNLVHASGNKEEADQEIGLWFSAEEIHDYKRGDEDIIY